MAANIIEHTDKRQRCLTAGVGICTQISCYTLIYIFFLPATLPVICIGNE